MRILERYESCENEKPMERYVPDGGLGRIFRKIAVIGDSLASGEFQTVAPDGSDVYQDFYEYSWGQYLARILGAKVWNFSRGGMTAKQFIETFGKSSGCWDKDKASQAYIVALGVNDMFSFPYPFGREEDFDFVSGVRKRDTFCGYYGEILFRYRRIEPDAIFFLMTLPDDGRDEGQAKKVEKHRAYLLSLAEDLPNTYVLDFFSYAPVYDAAFKKKFFMNGHMNPAGYIITAELVASYLDHIIRHDMASFEAVGLMKCMADEEDIMNGARLDREPVRRVYVEEIRENKKKYMDLLYLADEQEEMIDRYIGRGRMFLLHDNGAYPDAVSRPTGDVVGECVVTDNGEGVFEIKNIATDPSLHGMGYGRALIDYVMDLYAGRGKTMLVGTGDSPLTIPFYKKCGFTEHHRLANFFTDNYDHPIFEAGVQLVDMVYLSRPL